MNLGEFAVLITAVTGGIAGVGALIRSLRSDKKAESAQDRLSKVEEKSRAFHELEVGLEALGKLVDRANLRASECEKRETDYLVRISSLERKVQTLEDKI